MEVEVQFIDGSIEVTDTANFYRAIAGKHIYRFSIGTADFHNHDHYSIEDMGDHLRVCMWDLKESYPKQNWTEDGHACVREMRGPDDWTHIMYGHGSDRPWSDFVMPPDKLKINGVLISDAASNARRQEWPLSKRYQ